MQGGQGALMLPHFHRPLSCLAPFAIGEEAPSVGAFPFPGLRVNFLILGIRFSHLPFLVSYSFPASPPLPRTL